MSMRETKRTIRYALEIQSVGKTFPNGYLLCLDECGERIFKNIKCEIDFISRLLVKIITQRARI